MFLYNLTYLYYYYYNYCYDFCWSYFYTHQPLHSTSSSSFCCLLQVSTDCGECIITHLAPRINHHKHDEACWAPAQVKTHRIMVSHNVYNMMFASMLSYHLLFDMMMMMVITCFDRLRCILCFCFVNVMLARTKWDALRHAWVKWKKDCHSQTIYTLMAARVTLAED